MDISNKTIVRNIAIKFFNEVDKKNSHGKNQIHEMFHRAIANAALELADAQAKVIAEQQRLVKVAVVKQKVANL